MNGFQFNQELEFHLLNMLCEGSDYYRNEAYEIYLDNDLIDISFSDIDVIYDVNLVYFYISSFSNNTITVELLPKYITFRDIDRLHSDELYLKLYGYECSPYLKCLILFIAGMPAEWAANYLEQLNNDVKAKIVKFLT